MDIPDSFLVLLHDVINHGCMRCQSTKAPRYSANERWSTAAIGLNGTLVVVRAQEAAK